uniref:Uncharacterized protein n=1 Tax=mine drainage metagenome TaxID=410659 RepID=E6QJJ1_9ZZZZ
MRFFGRRVSLTGNIAPPMCGVMAPFQSAWNGVSNGVKNGCFWLLSQWCVNQRQPLNLRQHQTFVTYGVL